MIQDRSNRSILLSNVIQNNIFRKQTFFEFRHKTLMHWTFFLIHAFRKSKENAKKKCRFLGVTWFMKWPFECKLFSTSDTFSRVWFEIWHVVNFFCEIWRIVKFWTLNLAFRKCTKKAKKVVSRSNIFQYLFFESWIS